MRYVASVVSALIAISSAPGLTSERITFEDVPLNPVYPDSPGMSFPELTTDGYRFTSPVRVTAIFFPRDLGATEGEGKYLGSPSDQFGGPVSFSTVDGASFDLLSADVSEFYRSFVSISNFYSVHFTGERQDGSIVERSFILDGYTDYSFDRPTERKSFETVNFSDWINLKKVTVSGVDRLGGKGDFALDSILTNRSALPEPSTWAIMILGFGAVGSSMRRRQKAVVRFA